MRQDVQEHFQSADEFLSESEHLISGGFYLVLSAGHTTPCFMLQRLFY
ncbi:MAG: hypothetical protein ACE5NM_05975 [Sedimentisphaerales bacterium]